MSIVENTTARLLIIPPSGAVIGTPQTDRVALKPGFNKIDDDVLSHCLGLDDDDYDGNACVKSWFDLGYLVLMEDKREVPIPATLEGTNARDSIEFVKRVADVSLLRAWLSEETRATVRKAIDLRLVDFGGDDEDD